MYNREHEPPVWVLCVGVASSFLSTSWREFYFVEGEEEEAKQFADNERRKGKAVLVVTPEEY